MKKIGIINEHNFSEEKISAIPKPGGSVSKKDVIISSPKPGSSASAFPEDKMTSSFKPGGSASMFNEDEIVDEGDEENLDLFIQEVIYFVDPKIKYPDLEISEKDLIEWNKVERPHRRQLFDIINFDKVYSNMKLLESDIQRELVGTNIEVNIKIKYLIEDIKIKYLTEDMIIISFKNLLNKQEIAHFTFHNKNGHKYDPVGPYHFKIDDGSRRYSNLTFKIINPKDPKDKSIIILSIENKEQFNDKPEIILIIDSIERVLNDNKNILHK